MTEKKRGEASVSLIKRLLSLAVCLLVILGLAGCGSTGRSASNSKKKTGVANEVSSPGTKGKTLVVYFSATGTTKKVARIIADTEKADIYEIIPEESYTAQDLDYGNKQNRATREQGDKNVRPRIQGKKINLEKYDTVYLGYPIWWYEEPRIIDTFVEQYDFTGKTVIPFCTSNSAGIAKSRNNLKQLAKGGNWLEGRRFSKRASDQEIRAWVKEI